MINYLLCSTRARGIPRPESGFPEIGKPCPEQIPLIKMTIIIMGSVLHNLAAKMN